MEAVAALKEEFGLCNLRAVEAEWLDDLICMGALSPNTEAFGRPVSAKESFDATISVASFNDLANNITSSAYLVLVNLVLPISIKKP